jgi:hypothetical protein
MHVHSYLRDGQLVAVVSERCRATPCSDRFVLPSISDVSIALSSSYVCTFVSLMLVSGCQEAGGLVESVDSLNA